MDGFFLAPPAPFMFVAFIIWIVSHRKTEEKRLTLDADRTRGSDTGSTGRIKELEERVRVLERIVTDGSYDLARRIEALRDDRVHEARIDARPVAAVRDDLMVGRT